MPGASDDHAEIRNLLARSCVALGLDDIDEWVSLFWPGPGSVSPEPPLVDRATGEQRNAIHDDELVRTPEGWRIARCRCASSSRTA